MRHLLAALLLAASLLPARVPADDFQWPGRGVVRIAVPAGWDLRSQEAGAAGYAFKAQPKAGAPVVLRITLAALPADKPMRADAVKGQLEEMVRSYLGASVEKRFDPRPLALKKGTGSYVQLTDASLVGKPTRAGDLKVMRNALALLDGQIVMIGTLQFDDALAPQVAEAMALLASVSVDAGAAAAAGPFEFTVPESRVVLRVSLPGLRRDPDPGNGPGYFSLSRREPQLILSGWLEPASRYRGLDVFWEEERRSPAYDGPGAPTRVEKVKVGPWEVIAFDVPVPGGTSAHLRAERVEAGSWIDLHLSITAARPAPALRDELLAALRTVEVVQKPAR
jgi:hypothetical protein